MGSARLQIGLIQSFSMIFYRFQSIPETYRPADGFLISGFLNKILTVFAFRRGGTWIWTTTENLAITPKMLTLTLGTGSNPKVDLLAEPVRCRLLPDILLLQTSVPVNVKTSSKTLENR